MDKFEEYFRTTKHYENMLLEIARNQLSVSVFDKNGRKYRNHIVQTAYEVFQHQQAKVEEANAKAQMCRDEKNHAINRWSVVCKERDELQKRVDLALLGINGVMRWIDEDAIDDADFIRGGVLSALRRLEQALKGEG